MRWFLVFTTSIPCGVAGVVGTLKLFKLFDIDFKVDFGGALGFLVLTYLFWFVVFFWLFARISKYD
jgi:hypothetical protein